MSQAGGEKRSPEETRLKKLKKMKTALNITSFWLKLLAVLSLLLVSFFTTAQAIQIPFTTLDSTTTSPIEYAMVVATDTTSGRMVFDRTDASGSVTLQLQANTYYHIEANSLGYAPYQGILLLTEAPKAPITIVMRQRVANLSEIVVRDTLPPISYRPDTVTYNAKAFYTGQERKLKDLIEKMPGLEIDEDLKVTYRGQDVSTLLVEGKPFFGGDGELALKGLPANAVGRVQVLEDYKPLGFTLDPGARKQRALNIIIREEKNNVYFGELMAGAGGPSRHLAQADVFRFNRRTNNYLFAGSNNVERELLSFRSMMRLIGGDQLFNEGGFRELSNLSLRLSPPLYARDGKNQLLAFGSNHDVSKRSTLDTYVLLPRKIWSASQRTSSIFQTTNLTETTERGSNVRQQFGMLRATLTTKLPKQLVIRTTAQLHGTDEQRIKAENYRSNLGNRDTENQRSIKEYEGQLKANLVKRYETGNLFKINTSGRRQREQENLLLTSDTTFLGSLLSFTEEAPFAFQQENIPVRTDYHVDYRYHYRLSRKVFLEHGSSWSRTAQRQAITPSSLPTVNRNTAYRILSTDIGAVVKWKEADAVVRLGLDRPQGFDSSQRVFSSSYLLPEARLKFRSGPGSNVEVNWTSKTIAPGLNTLTAGPLVTSFTSYQFGLDSPRPTVDHSASLNYRFYNPIKGFGYNFSGSFGQQGGPSIISLLDVVGVDRSISFLAVDTPGRSWSLLAGLRRDIKASKLQLTGSWRNRQQLTLIGEEVIVSPVTTALLRGRLQHKFGENIRLKWRILVSQSTFGAVERGAIYNGSLTSDISYNLGNWTAAVDASGQLFDATATASFAGRIQGTVRYLLDDSPWAFEVKYSTPLGGQEYRNFRQSDLFFTSTDTQVFVAFISANVAYQF